MTYCLYLQTYLIDLIHATAHKKDGPSMCLAFEGMIDKAEDIYGVIVVAFCCDNDGGSQRGRKDLILKRPWLFGPPCCAHQVRVISIIQNPLKLMHLSVSAYSW
jgi:hypothetical protein